RSRRNRKWEIRPSSAPRQHLAHLCDKLVSLYRNLCRTILYPLGAAFDVLRQFAAESEILQLHFAFRPFVTAFDDGDGSPSPVGIFELIAEFLVAGIGFGADAGRAQLPRHREAVGHVFLVDSQHDHQRLDVGRTIFQGGDQTADADGNAGGRNLLSREARHEIVVTSAASDGAEDDCFAIFVGHGKRKLRFEYGAGVVIETAHNACVDADAIGAVATAPYDAGDLAEFR